MHRPGREIERLTTDSISSLLFEAVPDPPQARDSHDLFTNGLQGCGVEVVYVHDALVEILHEPTIARAVIEAACDDEHPAVADLLIDAYEQFGDEGAGYLADVLIGGFSGTELNELSGLRERHQQALLHGRPFVLAPLPNLMFARDPIAVVGEAVVISRFRHPARAREAVLLQAIFELHPAFNGVEVIATKRGSLEGGDVLVVSSDAVVIGCSERTNMRAIHDVAQALFERTGIRRVYTPVIRESRDCIHLDTVLSIIGRGVVVVHEPVIGAVRTIRRLEPGEHGRPRNEIEAGTLLDVLRKELEAEIVPVPTGGARPEMSATEQLHEGANLLAVAPGEVFAYERNRATNDALRAHGVIVHEVRSAGLLDGLGGPHCLTHALVREAR